MSKAASKKAGNAIGEMIAELETRILAWFMVTITLTPQRFETWLAEQDFRRFENGRQAVDYAGFVRWIRNSFIYLFLWSFSFEMYAIVLGHSNNDPGSFGVSLAAGFIIFYTTWVILISKTIGRISSTGTTIVCSLASLAISSILLFSPVYQYFVGGSLPFIEPDKVHELVAAGIPRYWAVLGFVFNTIVLLPFLWMVRLGPALLSLCFSKSSETVKMLIGQIIALVSSDETKSKEVAIQLQNQSKNQSTVLLVAWSGLALFTCTLLFSPTVWGMISGVVIGMVSVIVFWLRESNRFIGYFLTKALYGVATGGLIFICTLYGVSLATLMLAQAWNVSKALFGLLAICLLVGIVSAVLSTFYSTSENEQEELSSGKAHINSYSRTATGLDENGKPIFGLTTTKPTNWSWLNSKFVWIGVVAIGWVVWTQILGHPSPLDTLFAMGFGKLMLCGMLICVAMVVYGLLPNNDKTN